MFLSDSDIVRIGESLCDRSLPKSEWSHSAHVAAAVWLLDRYGSDAMRLMPVIIQNYNEATGVANTDEAGYHHTITLASLRAFQAKMSTGSLSERTNRLLTMGYDRPDWLLRHYSKTRLFSVAARRRWLDPDMESLPQL